MKIRPKTRVFEAVQFHYIDGIDGKKTVKAATALGLSRNKGVSLVWEIQTTSGWRVVKDGSWIITQPGGEKRVCTKEYFEEMFEIAPPKCFCGECNRYFELDRKELCPGAPNIIVPYCPYCGRKDFIIEPAKALLKE